MRRFLFLNADAGGAAGGGAAAAAPAGGGAGTLLAGTAGDGAAGAGGAGGAAGGSNTFAWAKEDGTLNVGWLEKLGGDMAVNPSLKPITTLQDLAKSYVATKALVGTKLEMPGEGATPEAVAAWRKTVGAPEKPEGYAPDGKSLRPESIPEALWDVEGEKKFLAIAHKHHLPPAAVKDILAYYGENIGASLQGAETQKAAILEAEGTKLRTAWGKDHDANMNLASRMAQTVGLDPKTNPIFTNADVVQAFARAGKLLSEDKLVPGESTGINGSIAARIKDFTDLTSTSQAAREYRGEFGAERQAAAQAQYHQLLLAQQQK